MSHRELAEQCIAELHARGMDKSQVTLNNSEARELYCNNGEISMVRTTFNIELRLVAIKDNKRGVVSLNKIDQTSIANAINDVIALAQSSPPDDGHDISEFQPPEEFQYGPSEPDSDKMYDSMHIFLDGVRSSYPKTHIREGGVAFHKNNGILKNSNGVDYAATTGHYQFGITFSSKEGDATSSINGSGSLMKDLDEPFIEAANLRQLLEQSEDEINARAFDQKFTGDIIITPHCMGAMIGPVLAQLRDHAHITGSSLFRGKLGQRVASDALTIRSNPVSDEFAVKNFFNGDGYKNENSSIMDKGVLKSNLLTLYGARKTGLDRAKTDGANLSIDPGTAKIADLIKSTKKGILLARISSGAPNDNGDFSGVAKNSYFIEDGVLTHPVKEVMVTGNVIRMIENVVGISEETINFGYAKYPWIKASGFTIAGK